MALYGATAYAQSAIDAFRISQPDMKGTARYMSMGGAFGALGGDLSTLSHNPAGIGVYRNNEVGFTLDLDLQNSSSETNMGSTSVDQTKFLLNNIGLVWTLRLPSATCPNVNFGFTYNKSASFNRRYSGQMRLSNSLSNYIAAQATSAGYSEEELLGDSNYDPYADPTGPDWLAILGYDGYLFSNHPLASTGATPNYIGQWGSDTKGIGYFDVLESGAIDSYNIALGGNIANVVYWGMDFDITHLNYTLQPDWTENLENARVDNNPLTMPALWKLSNYYNCSGNGFNYKLGFIVKPIQELRLGFAFQTPTWYTLNETYRGSIGAIYNNTNRVDVNTNGDVLGYDNVNFRSPWKINASAAAVLFNKLILSAEYEWTQYKKMQYSTPSYWGNYGQDYPWDDPWGGPGYGPWDDPWYPWYAKSSVSPDPYISNNPYYYTNTEISEYFINTNTIRLGAEYRVTPQFSVRAGYSFVSSPVKTSTKRSQVVTVGTIPNYTLDNTTNYISCGFGYRFKSFYVDLAYVYKHMSADYYPYSPYFDPNNYDQGLIPSQPASLSLNNSQIVLSAGFKF